MKRIQRTADISHTVTLKRTHVFKCALSALCIAVLAVTGCDNKATSGASGNSATANDGTHAGLKPHVVLVSLCSVRADHIGAYGYPRNTSPNLDAFAKSAVVFDAAMTPWPKTAPSFCSVMSGLYPHETKVMRTTPDQRLDDSVVTLAERFKQAGYRTGAYVSTPALRKEINLTQGFDTYQETYRSLMDRQSQPETGLAWLKANRDEPCMLWLHFNHAHYPYGVNPEGAARFMDDDHYDHNAKIKPAESKLMDFIPLAANHPAILPVLRPDMGRAHPDALAGIGRHRREERDYYVAQYDAGIASVDEYLGRVFNGLKSAAGDRPVIVVLWSDHGESMGEHDYYFEHGRFAYDSCSHVPFMIRCDGRWPNGKRVTEPVSTVDMAATITELAGIDGKGLSGMPLSDVIDGKQQRGDVFFCGGYSPDFITAVRRGNMKLLRIPNPLDQAFMRGRSVELYNIAVDPKETRDLAPANAETVADLSSALDRWTAPWWSAAIKQGPTAPGESIDADSAQLLKNMGYLSGDGETTNNGTAAAKIPLNELRSYLIEHGYLHDNK